MNCAFNSNHFKVNLRLGIASSTVGCYYKSLIASAPPSNAMSYSSIMKSKYFFFQLFNIQFQTRVSMTKVHVCENIRIIMKFSVKSCYIKEIMHNLKNIDAFNI